MSDPTPAWTMPTWLPQASVWVGLVCGAAGVVVGLVKMFHRVEADCPNGKIWRNNETDFTCHAFPQLGTGVAITAGSVMGVILIILVAYIASEVSRPAGSA